MELFVFSAGAAHEAWHDELDVCLKAWAVRSGHTLLPVASAALAGATGRPCLLIDSRAAGATPREWAPGDIFRIVLTARSTFADCAPLLSGADEILFVPHDLANIDVRLGLALARFATGQKQPVAQGQENDLYDAIEPFLDTAPLPLLISDAETGKPILVNRAATKLLGFTSESLEARGIESLQVNPAMRAAMFAELDRTGKVEAFPTIVCRSEGTRASVLVNLVRNQWKGRPALFGSLLDVTELKRASDRNTALIAALPDQVFEFTEEGVFESYHEPPDLSAGPIYAPSEFLGRRPADVLPAPAADAIVSAMARYDGSRVQHFEYELVLPDAGVRRIEARLSGKTTGGFVLTVRDVTERATMMNALRASEEKFRRLFETSPVAMSLALEEGTFLDANQAWCDIMGYRRDEVTSLTFQAITPPDFEQTTDARIREIAARGQYGPFDKEYFHRSGRRIPVRVSGTVLTDAQGLRFVWSIVTDITEQKESEERLVVAREKALEAARMKTQFLANMSHEIRTPMNAILGMTELLSDTPLDKNQLDCVETVRLSGDLLLAIINEILDFSKIESGLMTLEAAPFDLRTCIESTLDMVAQRAFSKRLGLTVSFDDATPRTVVGDSTRLKQILTNLLSNAIKFTERGDVSISVSARPPAGDGVQEHEIRIEVHDSGVGISPAHLNRLFKPFGQADESTTRRFGGTGLGLVISRRLAELMGGSLDVESAPGRGSTFTATFLAREVVSAPPAYLSHRQPHLAGRLALMVNPSAAERQLLTRYLETWGMVVKATGSMGEALEWARGQDAFDFALLDASVEEMPWLTLARAIRRGGEGGPPGLVLLTPVGLRPTGFAEITRATCLNKPIKGSKLHEALLGALGHGGPSEERRELVFDNQVGVKHPLRILLVEDNAINQKLALRLLERVGYRADLAQNGREAVDAVESRIYDLVLMDMQMPVMDGLDAARAICARIPKYARPRILALTANAMTEDRNRCLEAGMDGYLVKPIQTARLFEELSKTIRVEALESNESRMRASAEEPERGPVDVPVR